MFVDAFLGLLRRIGSEIGLFFQDSYGSLNPRMTAGAIVSKPLGVLRWTVLRVWFWGKMWVAGGECLRRVVELDEKRVAGAISRSAGNPWKIEDWLLINVR